MLPDWLDGVGKSAGIVVPRARQTFSQAFGHPTPGGRLSESYGHNGSTATGIRTPVSAVRGRRPSPLDDGGERGQASSGQRR